MPYTVHHKISELILKQLRGEITSAERSALDEWIQAAPGNQALYQELTTEATLTANIKDIDGLHDRIVAAINRQVPGLIPGRDGRNVYATDATKVIPLYRRRALRWIAAAAIIIVIAAIAYLSTVGVPAKTPSTVGVHVNDVAAPTNTRAVITLANGTKVYLDSAGNGTIAQENNVNVVKNSDGSVVYSHEGAKAQSEIEYNTLSNPRGSKVISLTLSDGTKVWLNAESSLKYPTAFTASTREVEITGEAYFEVKHNSKQPFKVHLPNGGLVEDIGTAFNVNAYTDEADIKTTLVEGSVRVFANSQQLTGNSQIIKPGQQAVLNANSYQLTANSSVDLDEVMAWQRGRFEFNNVELPTIMKQVSRWYDVDVVYEHQPKLGPLGGGISRNLPLSEVLKLLEANGAKFRLEGRKLFVL